MKIEGFDKLERQLMELGAKVGGRTLRSALMTASLPALRSIQSAAPVGSLAHRTYRGRLVAPGFLGRNIRRKSILSRDKSRATVLIGPASEAFYASFLEFGTSKMSAQPFMERAFRQSQDQVLQRFKDRLKVLIEKNSR